jgi:pimeloyl-ACP methyl ester carboxylesterase
VDLLPQQWEAIAISNGKTLEEARAGSGFIRIICEEINKNQDTATTFKNIRTRIDASAKTVDTATLAKIRSRTTTSVDDQIRQTMAALTNKWSRYFISFDPRPYLENLHCKVLALNGSRDVQIIASSNLAGIKASLQKSQSPRYDVIELPGLNHLFQTCIRCSPAEYGNLEETFSPTALTILDDWLLKNVQ